MKIPLMIKKRIDSNFFKSYRALQNYKLSPDSLPIEKLLHQRKKAILYQYFFSTRFRPCRNYYESVVAFLDTHYSDTSNPEAYDLDGIRIIKPCKDQAVLFGVEATDFLLYHIMDNHALCETATHEGLYEFGEVRISKGDIVIDCGANMGMFSAIAASKGAFVHAFEPDPDVIETYLSKTAKLSSGIKVIPFALADKVGTMGFTQSSNMSTSSLSQNTGGGGIFVDTTTLDQYIHDNNINKVDFIKADIEGAERDMLLGAQHVLKEFAPKIAICTYHRPDDPKVLRDLILRANQNYTIVEKWMRMYAYVPS